MKAEAQSSIHALREELLELERTLGVFGATSRVSYTVPSFDADSEEFSSGEWDGSAATSSYPNPSDEDTNMDVFRKNFMFGPIADSDEAENKSAYGGPIRDSHGGAINPNALQALISAINGARGGFKGIATDTLKKGYNAAVRLMVAAGKYEDKGDAPEFSASEESESGEDETGNEGEASAAPNPLEAASATSAFTATLSGGGDLNTTEADGKDETDALTGVIWSAGTHHLWETGDDGERKPIKVNVPEESIKPAFEALQSKIASDEDVLIGFDHPDGGSVQAQTALGEIGRMESIALSEDERQIVLTDSTYTNNKAVEAAKAGGFDGFEFSIVGGMGFETSDGDRVVADNGGFNVTGVNIGRVDVVPTGAIREPINQIPALASDIAARTGDGSVAAEATRVAASQTRHARTGERQTEERNIMSDTNNGERGENWTVPTDVEDVEAAEAALSSAADALDEREQRIQALTTENESMAEKAEAMENVAAALGVESDGEDDGFPVEAVINEFTVDTRREIASMEAALGKYETTADDVEARAEELEGSSVSELEAKAGTLAREQLRTDTRRSEHSGGVTAGETPGGGMSVGEAGEAGGSGGSGGEGGPLSEEEAEAMAADALPPSAQREAETLGGAAEWFRQKKDVEPTNHRSEHGLMAAAAGGDTE